MDNGRRQFRPDDQYPWPERFFHGEEGDETISSSATDNPDDAAVTGTQGDVFLNGTNSAFASDIGKPVLIIQFQGLSNLNLPQFNFELNVIESYEAGIIGLRYPLTRTYTTGSQIIVSDRYSSFTIDSGQTFNVKAWTGGTQLGGIIFKFVDGDFTNDGTINLKGRGFRGYSGIDQNVGQRGEGYADAGGTQVTPAYGNAGGGGGFSTNGPWDQGNGGGGGSNYGYGENGVATGGGNNQFGGGGERGNLASNAMLTLLFPGGGGGSGGDRNGSGNSGNGAYGGACMFIVARNIINNGTIDFDGNQGQGGVNYHCGAGASGAAGAGLFIGNNIDLGSTCHADGGAHVYRNGSSYGDEDGGYGGIGRIQCLYADSIDISALNSTVVGAMQSELYSDTYAHEGIFSKSSFIPTMISHMKKMKVVEI